MANHNIEKRITFYFYFMGLTNSLGDTKMKLYHTSMV